MDWKIYKSKQYQAYQEKYGTNTLLSKVLDFKQMDEGAIKQLNKMIFHDYDLFEESEEVIERILEAIEQNESICVYGDYDCDGILATTILVKAFKMLGKEVGYHIPHRFLDGYGLNEERVKQLHEKGYTLIITVDNGIKALDAVDLANEYGMDVIVTDHHAYGEELPNAYGFLHTKLSTQYPFKEISGGLVAYKLAYRMLNKHDRYLWSLASITTISDMMPMMDENRAIVKKGFKLMEECHFPAIDLLLGDKPSYTMTSVGFTLAPKINSFGRLPEYINPINCVKYFLSGDMPTPEQLAFMKQFAVKAKEINQKRQSMTSEAYQLLKNEIKEDQEVIFLYEQPIHEGLVGLLAGKFTKEFNKVSFLMNYDETSNVYKGSARSINGFKLNTFLESASEDLLFYGGHALAAGFTVKHDCIPSFYSKVKEAIQQSVFEEVNKECIEIDEDDLTLSNVKSLKLLEPFGMENEEPLFCLNQVRIVKKNLLSNGKHLKMSVALKNMSVDVLWFNCGVGHERIEENQCYTLMGQISVNEYMNKENIQLILQDVL